MFDSCEGCACFTCQHEDAECRGKPCAVCDTFDNYMHVPKCIKDIKEE